MLLDVIFKKLEDDIPTFFQEKNVTNAPSFRETVTVP
jgi:hypothetical protein